MKPMLQPAFDVRLMFVVSPHAPSGTLVTVDTLDKLAANFKVQAVCNFVSTSSSSSEKDTSFNNGNFNPLRPPHFTKKKGNHLLQ